MKLSKLIMDVIKEGYTIRETVYNNILHIVLEKKGYYLARDFSFSELMGSPENLEDFWINVLNQMVEEHKKRFEV